MAIEIPKHIAANPRYADLVAASNDVLITPAELAERWSIGVQHLGVLRRANKGPPFIKLAGGAIRYKLHEIVAHERAGEGGALSMGRLKEAIATLSELTEIERASLFVRLARQLYPQE